MKPREMKKKKKNRENYQNQNQVIKIIKKKKRKLIISLLPDEAERNEKKKKKQNRENEKENQNKKKLRSLEHYLCREQSKQTGAAVQRAPLCRKRCCVESALVQRECLTEAEARESWSLTKA